MVNTAYLLLQCFSASA